MVTFNSVWIVDLLMLRKFDVNLFIMRLVLNFVIFVFGWFGFGECWQNLDRLNQKD